MDTLYIAEKKQVAEAFSLALGGEKNSSGVIFKGDGFRVTWLSGHVLRLANPEDHDSKYERWNIDDLPMSWPISHLPEERHEDHLANVIEEMNKAGEICNICDMDEEGAYIFSEVMKYAGFDPRKASRVLINDNSPAAIRKAYENITTNEKSENMAESAFARAVCDQRYGFHMTRAYTLLAQKKGHRGVISVGRVVSTIGCLVVARDRAIEAHVKQRYFNISAGIGIGGIDLNSIYVPSEDDPVDDKNRIDNDDFAKKIAAAVTGKKATIVSFLTTSKIMNPPLPHSLISLQAQAAGEFNLKASKVLEITQQLRGDFSCITYNRSDSRSLNDEMHDEAPNLINALESYNSNYTKNCQPEIKSKAFNSEKVTAHHAIIPTLSVPKASDLNEEQKQVYGLIVKMYLAQFYPPEKYRVTSIVFDIEGYRFKTNGRVDEDRGWRLLLNDEGDDSHDGQRLNIESLKENDEGVVNSSGVVDRLTKPLSRYTLKTLLLDLTRVAKYVTDPAIKKLLLDKDSDNSQESGGIGTPATRANHIDNLFDRGFIKEENKKVISTELGRKIYDLLPDFAVKPDLTALWYEQQKMISTGELDYKELIKQVDQVVFDEIERLKSEGIDFKTDAAPCPACDDGFIVPRKNAKKEQFWSCSNFPSCKKTFPDLKGKPDFEGKKDKGERVDCDVCDNGRLTRRKGANGFFWGCSNHPKCTNTMQDKKGKPVKKKKIKLSKLDCPECDEKLVRRKTAKTKAKKSHWWGCSGFPGCKFTAVDSDGKPKLNKKNV